MVELEQTKVLKEILKEQRQTNALLLMLIDALSDGEQEDQQPTAYLSGKPLPPPRFK